MSSGFISRGKGQAAKITPCQGAGHPLIAVRPQQVQVARHTQATGVRWIRLLGGTTRLAFSNSPPGTNKDLASP